MSNALAVQRTRLPQSSTSLRAAQYIPMSTDYQRYSIENQAAVIATYAKMVRGCGSFGKIRPPNRSAEMLIQSKFGTQFGGIVIYAFQSESNMAFRNMA